MRGIAARIDALRAHRSAVARAAMVGDIREGWDAWSRAYWHAEYVRADADLRDTVALSRELREQLGR